MLMSLCNEVIAALRFPAPCEPAAAPDYDGPVETVGALMRRWLPAGLISRIHVDDPGPRGPGRGWLSFPPILRASREGGYKGNASIEPFLYQPDGPACAARGIGYIRGILDTLAA